MEKLQRIRMMACDVDGTLTGPGHKLSLEAASALRELEEAGVPVCLISGNSLPVLYALSVYLGLTGPVVAENGAIVYDRLLGRKLTLATPLDKEAVAEALKKRFNLEPTFQHPYREVDLAFKRRSVSLSEVQGYLEELGYKVRVTDSGFAIHVSPPEVSKSRGLAEACKLRGVALSEVAAVGDSQTDIDMLKAVGVPLAIANTPPEAKEIAALTVEEPNGRGVAKLARMIAEAHTRGVKLS